MASKEYAFVSTKFGATIRCSGSRPIGRRVDSEDRASQTNFDVKKAVRSTQPYGTKGFDFIGL